MIVREFMAVWERRSPRMSLSLTIATKAAPTVELRMLYQASFHVATKRSRSASTPSL